ncbi:MAG: tandem-95 repeat protein, partial [Caldilinea sp.]|nr:tandem-95 repeat protein [Caldilinea sp.]
MILILIVAMLGMQPANAAPAGTALQFDGTNDYVTFGTAASLGAQVFTIETWFKRTGTGATASTGTGGLAAAIPLVTKGRGEAENSNVDMNYFFGIDTTGVLAADFEECARAQTGCPATTSNATQGGQNYPARGTTVIQNNVWYHAAVTFDGRYWRFYLNGVQDGATIDTGATRYPRWDSIQHAGLGTAMTSTGAAAGYFVGVLDEVRIWNVVRTQAEIQASMNAELTGGAGLLGRWGMNEGTGTAAANSVVGNPNGTLTNGPLWVAGFPMPDLIPPAAPTALTATPRSAAVALSWTAPPDPDIAGYNVYRSTAPSVPLTGPVNGATLVTGTSYSDGGLTNGTPYYYVVTAVDTSTNASVASNEVSATPLESLGAALRFDGANDYVTFGPNLNAATFTLEAWIKREAGGATMTTGTDGLDGSGGRPLAYPVLTKGMGQGETPANINMNYFLGVTSTGVVGADFEDAATGGNHPAWGSTTIAVGEWHHIAATYNGSCWELYLDGSRETLNAAVTTCPNATPEATSIQHAGLAAGIGSTGQLSTGFFAGTIDEARVWNVARSQGEIQSTINVELTDGAGLIGRWGMNEGSGTTIADSTAPSANGTLTNGPTWAPGAPFDILRPTTPSNLIVAPTSSDQIYLQWQDNANNETGFAIERSSDNGTTFAPIGTVGPDVSVFDDGGLAAATAYCYRAYAENGGGASGFSNVACTSTAAAPGYGLDFGSATAYVTFGDPAALDLPQFTIETWFRRTGAGTPNTTGNGGIANAIPLVTHGAPEAEGSSVDANWVLVIDDANDVLAADFEDMATGANHPVYGVTPITNNVWHHAAATYDGTTWRLYLDGSLETTLAVNQAPRSDTTQRAALGAMIRTDDTPLGHFQGVLDEARVWNYARSQAEIQAAINDELTGAQSGLVARWGLNEGAGATVNSSAGASIPGTITNSGYAWVAGAPFDLRNAAPNAPSLVAPADGAGDVTQPPALTVNVTDPEADEMTVTFYGRIKNAPPAPDFTLIAIPDPQYYASTYPAIYTAQMQWIVENKTTRNIVYAASLGDNVDVSTNATQWDRAVAAYDILATGGVPYGLVAGNHDGAPASTAEFNARFATRKTVQASYGGRYGTSDFDNYYTLFEAGGMQFVAVFIEMDDGMTSASHPVLQWANSIIQMYSNRRAILVTHNLLNGGTATSFSAQGSAIFDALKGNANLFLMLGGHLDVARRRSDAGTNGNTIYSLRSDYQSVDSQQSGYLRIMRFSPAENLIYVSTYSPTQNKEYPNEVTENNFTLPYAMSSSGPFSVIGTASAAAGANATVAWNGLADGTAYEWYAVASDGNKQATSPIWSFTTANAQPACYTLTLSHTGSGSDPAADPSNSSGCPSGSYLAGATVSLSGAAPAAHWHIAGWSGTADNNSTAGGNTLTMPAANHTAGVTYAQNEYTLTIVSANGTVARNPAQLTYHDGDDVSLTATPASGWSFTEWSGALTGSANPATLTIHGDATVTANYTRIRYPLTVARSGNGTGYVTSSPAGINCGATCTANYDSDTLVTLDAVSALGSTFSGWSGEGCTGTGACQVTMDGAKSVTANFTLGTNVLSVSLAGSGGGSVSSYPAGIVCGADCSEDYGYNALVSLTATPDSTSTFDGWSGAGCSGTGTCQVTMDAAKSVTATFTRITYLLTVNKLGAGSGTVSSTPPVINCGATCTATLVKDSQITLAAAAASGSTFLGWAGSCFGTDPCVVTMDNAKSVSASFALVQYTISGNAGQPGAILTYTGGSVTADGSGVYAITVPAGWSGSVTPALAGYLFTPPSRSYTNVAADQPAQDFSAAPVIPPPSGLTCATLEPKPATASTGEKPQSKVWTHEGAWYAVFPTSAAGASSSGTWLWQLQGTVWNEVIKLSDRTDTKADVRVVGNLAHILLYADSNTQLVTAAYSGGSYQPWTLRPAAVNLPLPNSEVATIDVDSTGKMWLATRTGAGEIVVYHSDSPYATWSGPVVLDTGAIGNDDIEVVTALPNGTVGVLWSNQNTRRFGFRVHVDGADPVAWSANELPAAGSAFDNVGAGMADDHLNVAVAADSTLYAAVKTGYDTAGYPKIALLVRRPTGVWDSLYGIDEAGTRPLILLDESHGTLTLIYTSSEGYNPIVYRQSTTQTIAFGSRTTLRSGAFNDVSSMKANYSSEFVVLYSSSSEVAGQLCAPTPASGADLSITKSDGRTLVRPNDALVYTIVATNNGPQAVTGATVADPLPAALANATWTCSGSGGATCPASGAGSIDAVVNLPTGGAVTFRLTATVDLGARGTIENRASVAAPAGIGDPLPGNNQAVDLDTIVAGGVACDPAPGLVACWPMEENGGPALIDGSGNLNDAALYGTPAWVAGKVGSYALDINGTSQYALAADDDTLDPTGPLSLIAWIRPEQYATQDIIKKATNGGTNGYELSLATTKADASSRKVFFRINQVTSGDTYRINSATEYPIDGSWMHVAATFDGTTMRLYINSVLESSMELPAGTTIAANNLPVGIGAQSDGQRWFMGWLDEARIYSRALSLEEIQDLYGNRPPVAADDAYATDEDTPLSVAAPGVLGNDSDANNSALTAVKVTDPAQGTLALAADGSFTYTPAANFNGSDSFTYRASDGQADSNVATVRITIAAVNDAPTANAQSVTTAEDTPLAISLTGSDIDGDSLTFAVATPPQNGTLSGTAPNLTYTPAANFNGSDSFTFQASDGTATSAPATVAISVTPVNDAPSATAQSVTTA